MRTILCFLLVAVVVATISAKPADKPKDAKGAVDAAKGAVDKTKDAVQGATKDNPVDGLKKVVPGDFTKDGTKVISDVMGAAKNVEENMTKGFSGAFGLKK